MTLFDCQRDFFNGQLYTYKGVLLSRQTSPKLESSKTNSLFGDSKSKFKSVGIDFFGNSYIMLWNVDKSINKIQKHIFDKALSPDEVLRDLSSRRYTGVRFDMLQDKISGEISIHTHINDLEKNKQGSRYVICGLQDLIDPAICIDILANIYNKKDLPIQVNKESFSLNSTTEKDFLLLANQNGVLFENLNKETCKFFDFEKSMYFIKQKRAVYESYRK